MPERVAPVDGSHADWATQRRARWNAWRVAAALLLHLLVLTAVVIGTGRVRVQDPGIERLTTLVQVSLELPKPPATPRSLPKPGASSTTAHGMPSTSAAGSHAADHARLEPASEPVARPMPAPETSTAALAAMPPASAPSAPLTDILNTAATRAAIRDVARGTRLSRLGDAATHVDAGSELVAADGSHCEGCTRDLAPSKRALERLSQAVAGAARPDCLKMSSAAGLLALPALVYGEVTGKCGN